MTTRLEIEAGVDELGAIEEFTWDLYPVIDPELTKHLDTNGLPSVGTHIVPGMIVIGKIGKTRNFDPCNQPSALEIHGLPLKTVRERYGHMWKDSSVYADSHVRGAVREAYFEEDSGVRRAVVVLAQDES